MNRSYRLSCVLFLALTMVGCFRSNRPEGLPKLYPCSITVTQDGQPLAGASIQLVDDAIDRWPVTGLTNSSGTASLVTYGKFPGAPAGEYRVIVKKSNVKVLSVGDEHTSGSREIYSLVAIEYTKGDATPLKIRVEKGRNRQDFDIGQEVRILVDKIRPGSGT